MNIFKNIILIVILCLLSSPTFSRESNGFSVYSGINEIKLNIGEDEYKEIIRLSLFEQPEFQYISSLTAEEKFNLKFAKRNRFPVISGNILNDESLDRNITDITSVRKRRDDSFDATVELTQTLYSGGSVNAGIRAAKSRSNNKNKEKQKTISQLILDANTTYLDAAKASFILNYAEDILKLLKPFKTKVDDRVKAGIMDPVDYALFSVRLNTLETRIYQLKSNSEKDKNQYTVFFKKNFEKLAFPMFSIEGDAIYKNNKSYDVEMSELSFVEKKEDIKNVRSEYLPSFGIRARYTKYDIDDDTDEDDIRGGLFLSMPIFSFGRGAARINAAKAAAQGSENYINITKKSDRIYETRLLSDYSNSISNREVFIRSFNDTIKQRETIFDRLEVSGFAINSLAEVMLSEITQLENLLDNESVIIKTHLAILHQNQALIPEFKIRLKN